MAARRVGAGVMLGCVLLTGCTRTVEMDEPTLTGAPAQTCSALMAQLPTQVLKQDRRTVQPGVFGAAWGDPTLTLRCGVPKPAALGATSECLVVNGVGWFGQQADGGGTVFTTIGRSVYVQVAVPAAYAPAPAALTFFADTVKAHTADLKPCQ